MEYFKPLKLTAGVPLLSLLLFILSLTGAITFPASLSQSSDLDRLFNEVLLLLLSALLLNLLGRAIGEGVFIMSKLHPMGARILALVAVYALGSLLALFTLLDVSFAAHLNLFWKGANWYDPWLTMFIVGAPIMLSCMI